MEIVLPRSRREEFAQAAVSRREDIRHKEKMAQFEATLRQRREIEAADLKKKEEREAHMAMLMTASPHRVIAFRQELDRYDTRTVDALMENRKALDKVQDRLDQILAKAHKLDDGRRVFKHEDGVRVFDEFRQEVPREVIDPDVIPDHLPRYGVFLTHDDAKSELLRNRDELIEFQNRVGESRDKAKDGITNGDLNDLEADLKSAQPDWAKHKRAIDAVDAKPAAFNEEGPQLAGRDPSYRQADSAPRSP